MPRPWMSFIRRDKRGSDTFPDFFQKSNSDLFRNAFSLFSQGTAAERWREAREKAWREILDVMAAIPAGKLDAWFYEHGAPKDQSDLSRQTSTAREANHKIPKQDSTDSFLLQRRHSYSSSDTLSSETEGTSLPLRDNSSRYDHSDPGQERSDLTAIFPYVSDVAAVFTIVFLEVIRANPDLLFEPLKPCQSVGSTEYLNYGASFSVTRVPWDQFREDTAGRKWTDVVYKRINRPAPNEAWRFFLKELLVTYHMSRVESRAMGNDQNIVKLLGVGWETIISPDLSQSRLSPVIAIEYAPYGTLGNLFYSRTWMSSYPIKRQLLLDIAEGLTALHLSGIVHGDLKPDNILVYKHPRRGVIAKLSDFGFSILDIEDGPNARLMPGYTYPYDAPEVAMQLIPRGELIYTDVYSFGIVAWQTLLHGKFPFFSYRYRNGEPLDKGNVQLLKKGQYNGMAHAYGLKQGPEQPSNDPANELLLLMARDSLLDLDESMMPMSELPRLTALLRIALSSCPEFRRLDSCRIILEGQYRHVHPAFEFGWKPLLREALKNNQEFYTLPSRMREVFTSTFERLFITLSKRLKSYNMNEVSQDDMDLCARSGSVLTAHHLRQYLAGDRSQTRVTEILHWLKAGSASGDLDACLASFNVHQFLGLEIQDVELYTAGMALALKTGSKYLFRQLSNHLLPITTTIKAHIADKAAQEAYKQLSPEQTRLRTNLLSNTPTAIGNVNIRDANGNTLLHSACRAGDANLSLKLVRKFKADASIRNGEGQQPIHWLHEFEAGIVSDVTEALIAGGADIECRAVYSLESGILAYSEDLSVRTPLLNAVLNSHYPAVKALVNSGARVHYPEDQGGTPISSPLEVAARNLDAKCLKILLPAKPPDFNCRSKIEACQIFRTAIRNTTDAVLVKSLGSSYKARIKATLSVLVKSLGRCHTIPGGTTPLEFAVLCGSLAWVEEILLIFYSSPIAVLADMQKALALAIEKGHLGIFEELTRYGALPLLPHSWAFSDFVAGFPGKWPESLVQRLLRQTNYVAETTCCLHLCGHAGHQAASIAKEILDHPSRNPCLRPTLPPESNGPHLVDLILDGGDYYPGRDRKDESGNTALYHAVSQGEFELAKLLISRGSSKDPCDRMRQYTTSLASKILSEDKSFVDSQLKFLFDESGNRPFFKMRTRMEREPEATLITAAAHACRNMNDGKKRAIWDTILRVFSGPDHLLYRARGKTALQLAVEAGDNTTLECIMDCLRDRPTPVQISEDYSVVDQLRDKLIGDAPPKIADAALKEKIIEYRCTLGEMIDRMLNSDDYGVSECDGLVDKILEVVDNEYPILAHGFKQRGEGLDTIIQFQSQAERFLKAFLTCLYSYRSRDAWLAAIGRLREGFRSLLKPYFMVDLSGWESQGRKHVKMTMEINAGYRDLISTQRTERRRILWQQHHESGNNSYTSGIINIELYTALLSKVDKDGQERFSPTTAQLSELADIGFRVQNGDIVIPGPEGYIAALLGRATAREIMQTPDFNAARAHIDAKVQSLTIPRPLPSRLAEIVADGIARSDYADVLRQINPHSRASATDSSTLRQIRNLCISNVESRIDAGLLAGGGNSGSLKVVRITRRGKQYAIPITEFSHLSANEMRNELERVLG